jgi:hypothetical protein
MRANKNVWKSPVKKVAAGLGGSLPPGDTELGEPVSRVEINRLLNNKQAHYDFISFLNIFTVKGQNLFRRPNS